jgi:hypothetical protein
MSIGSLVPRVRLRTQQGLIPMMFITRVRLQARTERAIIDEQG